MIEEESGRRFRGPVVALVVAAIIVAGAVGLALMAGNGSEARDPAAQPAAIPTSIDYVDFGGADGLIAAHAGRPLVINFFASWCAPCRAELPDFAEAHARYGSEVAFVGIDYNEFDEAAAARLLYDTGITYVITEDPDGEMLQELAGLPAMPSTVFVSAEGEIVNRHNGIIFAADLEDAIEEAIAAA